jgi:hypothetical protein
MKAALAAGRHATGYAARPHPPAKARLRRRSPSSSASVIKETRPGSGTALAEMGVFGVVS